jgi:integrase
MLRAEAHAAAHPRDALLVLLLGRLGMRIGAAVQLRLSGIVEEYDPGLLSRSRWTVRRVMQGRDKNGQVNNWDTEFMPGVRGALETYVNDYWRPRYERWLSNGHGLANGYLFPGRRVQMAWSRRYASARVTAVLLATGVERRRAHCHAFRTDTTVRLSCVVPEGLRDRPPACG